MHDASNGLLSKFSKVGVFRTDESFDTQRWNLIVNRWVLTDFPALKKWNPMELNQFAWKRVFWNFSIWFQIEVNPAERLPSPSSGVAGFVRYISDNLPSVTLDYLLEPSDVVGNIRFGHPTLYVFPGGQGDSALFGISGFNILVDGGFGRKPCFWDFTRHLDR